MTHNRHKPDHLRAPSGMMYGACQKSAEVAVSVAKCVICVGLLTSQVAYANCARDVQDITPKVQTIKDQKTRLRAQDYLHRAQRELSENDEFECQTAVGVVQKLIDGKTIK
jgi:hypothetical protein